MRRGPGRPPTKTPKNSSIEIKMTDKMYEDIAGLTDNMSEWGRQLFEDKLAGRLVNVEQIGLDDYRAKFLTRAPAGEWQEAVEHAGAFTISKQMADYLEVREGDVVVGMLGESMSGVGLHDGYLLLMRPLPERIPPKPGEVALVQIETESGEFFGTIKHWHPAPGPKQPARLTDGDGHDFSYPTDVKDVKAIAVARGVIGRM